MHLKRVVITGMGAVSPFGRGVRSMMEGLIENRGAVGVLKELSRVGGLLSHVGARVRGVDAKEIPRKQRRSMSPMSVFATLAAQEAITQSRMEPAVFREGKTGVVIGSTIGSPHTIFDFFEDFFADHSLARMKSSVFFKLMNHSVAANIGQSLGLTGRILAPSAACATGCQAVGYGYEMIRYGIQDAALCGGADEFHPLTTATFDIMDAASRRYNDSPANTPRPFDRDRDGVVCAEGAGVLLLEALEVALRRGAPIFAEVCGFAANCDPSSIANPDAEGMKNCMLGALEDANIQTQSVDYVNAHATGTIRGDLSEAEAIHQLFGDRVPVSSMKGHLGHTMAASGALETIASVMMLNRQRLVPTRNLVNPDPACAKIRHVTGDEPLPLNCILKNSFALGGVNTSIVVRRFQDDQ